MIKEKFNRLLRRGALSEAELESIGQASSSTGTAVEELLVRKGIPKHEVLFCLSEYYGLPFVEYDESVIASYFLTLPLDMEHLKQKLWFPRSVNDKRAEVIACRPDDPGVIEDIKDTLQVEEVSFLVALPSDLRRIIEHNFDVNPRFPFAGGRTPLAKVRTYLAYRRSAYAHYRTLFAKGRTGLAFIRTGISFIVIALLFLRVFGIGFFAVLEVPLLVAGIVMLFDGVKWYLPARHIAKKPIENSCTEPDWGTCVLQASTGGDGPPAFSRAEAVPDAADLRAGWENLSPVMRRRFLASDRTDMAEDRTALAGHRTKLARARTGLAFTRTGIALIGLGIGLFRQFHAGRWSVLDLSLIAAGLLMSTEGFYWYFGGRRAGMDSFKSVLAAVNKESIWDRVFPLRHNRSADGRDAGIPPVRASHLPGVWATTGLALERTVLADRRCLMARLRSVLAVERTGLAFVRTGMSIFSVGAGLLVYFGFASAGWAVFNIVLMATGLALIVDGYYWIVPTARMVTQYPYCFGDMEITIPDYGIPAREWRTVIFNHYDE
jgi:uncharacterized membrane protein YidH (DUF202 family)